MPTAASRTARILAIVIGVVVALVGLLAVAGGVILLGVFGSDGTAASGQHRFDSARTALVGSIEDLDDVNSFPDAIGQPRVELAVRSRAPRRVFVGVGRATDVDRYLAGAPIDRVTDFDVDPFKLARLRGGPFKAAPPAAARLEAAGAARLPAFLGGPGQRTREGRPQLEGEREGAPYRGHE